MYHGISLIKDTLGSPLISVVFLFIGMAVLSCFDIQSQVNHPSLFFKTFFVFPHDLFFQNPDKHCYLTMTLIFLSIPSRFNHVSLLPYGLQSIAHQALLSMRLFWQEYWRGSSFPSPGDHPDPGIESRSPALQIDSLPSEPPGKPPDI